MSQLTEAEAALDAAQNAYSKAQGAANAAQARADEFRQRVASGGGAAVTPAQLADADHSADHANLVAAGASQGIHELTNAVSAARADEEVDQIVTTLPKLGDEVVAALDAVGDALAEFEAAAGSFDAFVERARARLATAGGESPRVKTQPYGVARVDGIPLSKCRASSHLARAILPTMRAVKAPDFATTELKALAQGASPIPTTN